MVKNLTHSFTAQNELKDLFDGFKEELKKNPKLTLGNLGDALKEKATTCEKAFPIYMQFRKFERPKRIEGSIEGTVTIPQITTVDSIREVTNSQASANQQIISKTTFVLTPNNLKELAKQKQKRQVQINGIILRIYLRN